MHIFFPTVVSSSTAALTSSARILLSTTLQPLSTSKAPQLSSTVAVVSSVTTLLSTTRLQPIPTSKAPQPTYSSTLNFHTLHTVLPSSSQYKPTESSPAGSTTPEFSPSVTRTSSANFEHTTVYQTALVTPSVSPTPADPHPIAGILGMRLTGCLSASPCHVACTEYHCKCMYKSIMQSNIARTLYSKMFMLLGTRNTYSLLSF